MRILLTEDDPELAHLTSRNLKKQGFAIDLAFSGQEALDFLQSGETYDAVVLDLNLPDIDGMKLLRKFKLDSPQTPIMALTARDALEDKIAGLQNGFDDYLTKPFSVVELAARLKVLCRLLKKEKNKFIKIGPLKIFPKKHKVLVKQKPVKLSLNEFRLLYFLAQNQGQKISAEKLLASVWDINLVNDQARLLTTMSRLRKKIGDRKKQIIKTVAGGYIIGLK